VGNVSNPGVEFVLWLQIHAARICSGWNDIGHLFLSWMLMQKMFEWPKAEVVILKAKVVRQLSALNHPL